VVELDAKCENPEQRPFDEDFGALIKTHRADLLTAILIIWRWGRHNNLKPGMPLGSFEQWAAWCRDPLLALGCVDPVQRAVDAKSEDPRRELIFEFLRAWHAQHGSKPVKLKNLDPKVSGLIGNRQKVRWFVENLKGVRIGGFVMKITRRTTKSGTADYAVADEDEMTAR
jgi:hypothetical protein